MTRFIPTMEQYKEELSRLSSVGDTRAIIVLRLGCEAGMARQEIAKARKELDKQYKRGLWIEMAKKVRRGKKGGKPHFEMRSRMVPINRSLYPLLKMYADNHDGSPYLIHKDRKINPTEPLTDRAINTIYEVAEIPWPSHISRHFFRAQTRFWMIKNRRIDIQLIKEIMGHKLTVDESYGGDSPFEYKLEIVDAVFG